MTVAILCALALSRAADWQVNPNNTLMWNGKPYLPVGLCVDGNPSAVEKAAADGVTNVVVSLPADGANWGPCFKALNDNHMQFIVQLSSPPPSRETVIVDPAGYRVPDISRKTTIDLAIPDASEALLVLATLRDGSIRWSRRVPIVDGHLKDVIDPTVDLPHVLLVYPVVKSSESTDFYDGLDDHRDRLLSSFQKSPPGDGYRGLLDPFGANANFPGADCQGIPTSRLFEAELAGFLETKYSAISTALQAWGISTNDIKDFGQLSRMVPLWSETRGVANIWDTQTDMVYGADRTKSLAWSDIRTVLRSVAARRTKHLIDNIKNVTHGPVFCTWTGWDGPYGSVDTSLDGTAFEPSTKSIPVLMDDASRPVSSSLRSGHAGVTLATGMAANGGIGIQDTVAELEGIGVRGWFFKTDDDAERKAIGKLSRDREADTSASEWKVQGLFYPEAAQDPAIPMRLLGGLWWLPAPSDGQRLNLGSGIEGYRTTTGSETTYILWSTVGPQKIGFRVSDPKELSVTTVDGTPIEFKKKKTEVELELPTSPTVFRNTGDFPVPGVSLLTTVTAISLLLDNFDSKVNLSGAEQYTFADAVKAYDRSPGASFETLRAQLMRLAPRAAPYVWVAASRSPKHNFGEYGPMVGSSSENVLLLSNRFRPAEGMFFAEYPLSPHVVGTHEVWVAAKIPPALRDKIRIRAGDRLLGPASSPVSYYGDGFGWYKFGEVEVQKGVTNFRIEVPSTAHGSLALDVIAISPPGFRPQGPKMPLDWLNNLKPIKKGKDSGGL